VRRAHYTPRGKRILTPPFRARPIRAAHPAVRVIWEKFDTDPNMTVKGTARRSGLEDSTLRGWRRGASPRLADVEAVLNVLGLKLVVVSVDNKQ
jgi:transposase-like protein